MSEPIKTSCAYCGVGCGVLAAADGTIRGDPAHPANRGRLCSKGSALGETLDDSGRLRHPTIDGRHVRWDEALDRVAAGFRAAIEEHGPDSVAFYVSGQFLTEDYYVANKLMKGFIGSANIDTNSRLCMASSVSGHVRAFGEDLVPGIYEDWEQADLVVLVGSNTAWCHPVLYQRLLAARAARGTKIVVIDPRRTATAEQADLHLGLAIGTDVTLFAGLLCWLANTGAFDTRWLGRHASAWQPALLQAREFAGSIDRVAALTGLAATAIEEFYGLWRNTERVVTAFSQGVNQASAGTDKVNAIVNCHLATGRIGRPGMGPFSLTGQPNAMGGREVGGLATQLAAHMSLDDPTDRDLVRRFWQAPNLAQRSGLKAVEMFEAVADGRIKAIWIAATNPAVSMPASAMVRRGLTACPLVVVSDCWETDTTGFADIVLPAEAWGEKEGTVTNSERMISRQRRFRTPPGDARPDWWMFAEVARRLGWGEAFAWTAPAEIFREHAALSRFENNGSRVFDLGPLATIDDDGYHDLQPVRWPVAAGGDGRLFGDGGFPTQDGRARLVSTPWRPPSGTTRRRPFRLNTGRIRDQWHTMTRTGLAPRLMSHQEEPFLDLSADDAARIGVGDRDLVRVDGEAASVVLRARIVTGLRAGEVFVPFHWSDRFGTAGAVDRLLGGERDPVSGQPALKAGVVRIAPLPTLWRAAMIKPTAALPQGPFYAVRVPLETQDFIELAGWSRLPHPDDEADWAHSLLGCTAQASVRDLRDDRGSGPALVLSPDRTIEGLLWIAAAGEALPARESLLALIGVSITDQFMRALNDIRAAPRATTREVNLCSCHAVTRGAIEAAIMRDGLSSVGDVGRRLRAGTNCGSCIPEIETLLRERRPTA